MQYLRSSIYWVLFILSTVVFGLLIILALSFSADFRLHIARSWGYLNLFMLKWICGLDFRVEGVEHVQEQNAIVL